MSLMLGYPVSVPRRHGWGFVHVASPYATSTRRPYSYAVQCKSGYCTVLTQMASIVNVNPVWVNV